MWRAGLKGKRKAWNGAGKTDYTTNKISKRRDKGHKRGKEKKGIDGGHK